MPCEITWEPRGIYRRFYGFVSVNEVMDSTTSVHGDSRFDDILYSIVDCLEVTGHGVKIPDLEMVAAYRQGASNSNARIVFAMVVVDEGVEGLLRHLDSIIGVGVNPAHFFGTMAAARHWIEGTLPLQWRGTQPK